MGWSLGLFEAGMVYTLKFEVMEDPLALILILAAPMVLYGWGGWLLGLAATRIRRKLPWRTLYGVSVLALFLLRMMGGLLPSNWGWAGGAEGAQLGWMIGGALCSFAMFRLALSARWNEDAARLSALGGQVSLLILPAFFVMFLVRGDTGSAGGGPDSGIAPEGAPNLVLVTWDTVRADTLPLYGGAGLETPHLDRLASEGLTFDRFQAVAPITGPSHASMLAGLYPPSHGLRSNGLTAPDIATPWLPQICGEHGYATAGFVSGYALRGEFGFARDFQVYDYRPVAPAWVHLVAAITMGSKVAERLLPREILPASKYIPGEVTLDRAVDWYRGTGDRPAFLWAHFFDAHHPYDPPAELRQRALARAAEGPRPLDPSVEEDWVLQRGEIERMDALLGELLVALEEKDPGLENTMVMLLADHGECFGEGGHSLNHHYSLFDATQNIVGVIRPAGGMEPRRVAQPSSQVDVMPTMLAAANLPIPEGIHGVDLGTKESLNQEDRSLYMEAFQRNLSDQRLHGWQQGGWRFVRSLAGEEWLFRVGETPQENHLDTQGERANALRAGLDEFLSKVEITEGIDNATEADHQYLEDLGYGSAED